MRYEAPNSGRNISFSEPAGLADPDWLPTVAYLTENLGSDLVVIDAINGIWEVLLVDGTTGYIYDYDWTYDNQYALTSSVLRVVSYSYVISITVGGSIPPEEAHAILLTLALY